MEPMEPVERGGDGEMIRDKLQIPYFPIGVYNGGTTKYLWG